MKTLSSSACISSQHLWASIRIQLSKHQNQDSRRMFAHKRAVENWLTKYKSPSNSSNLEKVNGYLEAFHHLSMINAWESAGAVIAIRLRNPIDQELHHQLGTWGYYSEQFYLYSQLLGKLNLGFDVICLSGMGSCCHANSKFEEAINYYEQALEIIRQSGDSKKEGTLLNNLGLSSFFLGKYEQSFEYYQQRLVLAWKDQDCLGEGSVLNNLGLIFQAQGKYGKALKYQKRSLVLLNENGERSAQGVTLGSIGATYGSLGMHDLAIQYQKEQLKIMQEIQNLAGESDALCNLGATLAQIGEYSEALKHFQSAQKIFQQTGNLATEAFISLNMAGIYAVLEQYNIALNICELALLSAARSGIPLIEDCWKLKNQLLDILGDSG